MLQKPCIRSDALWNFRIWPGQSPQTMQFLFSSHPLLNCVMASLILRWQALWIYVGLLCAQGICPTGYSTWVIRTVDKDNRYCTFLEEKHILNWKFELGKINETLGNKSLLITGLIFPTINSNLHRYICQDWKKKWAYFIVFAWNIFVRAIEVNTAKRTWWTGFLWPCSVKKNILPL